MPFFSAVVALVVSVRLQGKTGAARSLFEAVGRGRSKAGIHEKSHAKKASEPIVKEAEGQAIA